MKRTVNKYFKLNKMADITLCASISVNDSDTEFSVRISKIRDFKIPNTIDIINIDKCTQLSTVIDVDKELDRFVEDLQITELLNTDGSSSMCSIVPFHDVSNMVSIVFSDNKYHIGAPGSNMVIIISSNSVYIQKLFHNDALSNYSIEYHYDDDKNVTHCNIIDED